MMKDPGMRRVDESDDEVRFIDLVFNGVGQVVCFYM